MCVSGVWEIQSGDSNQLVHMNILITCVFGAFLLGALIAGMVVYCYRDAFLRKPRKIHKDAELAPSCTDSTGSFAKLNGLFESPVKEYPHPMDTPKLYSSLLNGGKEVPPSPDAKTMILSGQNPDLTALPTPESTPVLQQKNLQPVKNQWERSQGKPGRKDCPPKSPQYLPSSSPTHPVLGNHQIPSAVVLPNATHEHRASSPDGPRPEKKVQNGEHHGSKSGPEIPPKVPSREASLYSPSSSLPRNSPTKRVDVPSTPTSPTGQPGGTLERQRYHRGSSQRHSISSPPKGLHSPNGMMMTRQPSFSRGGYVPPMPPSRLDSHGVPIGMTPSLSRQSSYSGHGSLPRTSVKRTASLKPDVPPKPNGFVPQTAQMRVVNKYSY
uniref:Sema domain, transmembrane domain (TM), and cytoplasmic domain, (semaphorin) 6D, like n=1 Tax=Astyanax mexicanus TaxID=7994 RepID=A0A8B9JFS5_ASTMX